MFFYNDVHNTATSKKYILTVDNVPKSITSFLFPKVGYYCIVYRAGVSYSTSKARILRVVFHILYQTLSHHFHPMSFCKLNSLTISIKSLILITCTLLHMLLKTYDALKPSRATSSVNPLTSSSFKRSQCNLNKATSSSSTTSNIRSPRSTVVSNKFLVYLNWLFEIFSICNLFNFL